MVELVVFVVALAARLSMVLTALGGPGGDFGYDASVYYAAADSLTFGRLPYRDFVLLHPPGIMLALTPFAWLGRLTTDHVGFMAGNLGFTVLGAVNAVLVVRVAKRMGLPARSALLGGLFYALWLGSADAEYLGRLEPLGAFLFLCALLAILAAHRSGRRRHYLLAGLALGAVLSVKIWCIVPALILVGWQLARRYRRGLPFLALGAAAALAVVDGPFFLAAPSTMWHMVITEQLGRPPRHTSTLQRLGDLTTLTRVVHLGTGTAHVLSLALFGLLLAVLALACRVPTARVIALIAAAQLVVLLRAPSWYGFYADYVAAAAAVCVAAACAPARRRVLAPATVLPWLSAALAAAGTLGFVVSGENHSVVPADGDAVAASVVDVRCTTSPSPMGLILIDALSRDLRDGCPDWVDVSGRSYGIGPGPGSRGASHLTAQQWQDVLRSYLFSGQAVVFVPESGTVPDTLTQRELTRSGVLARAGGTVVYRTPIDARAVTQPGR